MAGRLTVPLTSRLSPLLAPLGCLAVLLADAVTPVAMLPCPFRAATGLDCPLCGMTRATRSIGRGDAGTAAGFNVLVFAAVPLAAYWATSAASAALLGRPLPRPRLPRWAWMLGGLALLVFAVARNLPLEATGWLASYR